MSNALDLITADIYGAQDAFQRVLIDPGISFEREAGFAIQVISASDYATKLAKSNRQSVVDAVTNIAAIGISLNPAKKQAYLVPRDGKICLDISYMGLIELAVASGSILWAQAKVVHAADNFEMRGPGQAPVHGHNPFAKDRGEIVGVYVVAKTASGDFLTEVMSVDEINAIRDRSTAWKRHVSEKKPCPWASDWSEMARKTVVKRAYKYWPKTDRLDQAIHHMNTEGGEGLADVQQPGTNVPPAGGAFDLSAWLAKVTAAKTEPDVLAIYQQGIKAAADAKDRGGYEAFKAAAVERRHAIREADAERTVDMEGAQQ